MVYLAVLSKIPVIQTTEQIFIRNYLNIGIGKYHTIENVEVQSFRKPLANNTLIFARIN